MNSKSLFAFIFLILSCSNKMNSQNWQIIHGSGIEGENKAFNFIFFIDSMNVVMLGTGFSDRDLVDKRFDKFNSEVYFSKNNGFNWTKKTLGSGKFSCFAVKNKIVYISKTIKANNYKGTSNSDSAIIYVSKDLGNSWIEKSNFSDFFVRDIFILSEQELYLIGKKNNESFWTLKRSLNSGLTWYEVAKLTNSISSPVIFDGNLYYLNQREENLLARFSFETGKTENIQISTEEFKPRFLTFINSELYVTGLLKKRVSIYKAPNIRKGFEKVVEIEVGEKFPLNLHSVRNKLILFLGERNSIGVSYYVYTSEDNKSKWNCIPVPSGYFEPYTFFENQLLGYSYDGKFFKYEPLVLGN